MAFSEWEDCFQWTCDGCSKSAEFPPGDFWQALAELKSRGWRIGRDNNGWSHHCQRCQQRTDITQRTFKTVKG